MENYPYTVYFEANNLSDTALKHIQTYFQIKRRSGGGVCEIHKVGANTYKICFMTKEAQERVLTRKEHVVTLPGKERICVSLSCDNVAESNKQSEASDQQVCGTQTCASAKRMEKVIKLESYLLRFLSESTKAASDLEQRLSVLSSTFQIHTDSEEIVVVRDQAAQDSCNSKWDFAVQEVFVQIQNCYILHFEVETDRLTILKENSFLSNENIRIYHEETLAVVVGQREQVEKMVKLVDTIQSKQQDQRECHISKKQFALVREQFEQKTKSSFPNIKIDQERPGILILKGPEKEVYAGEKELLNLVSEIKEKKIPLHHSLLTFLESSGSIQHFQNRFQQSLRSPVMLENAGSDLLLLSLSDGALLEAASAVQRDLCYETISLEKTENQSPVFITLQEALSKAVQQANHGGVKVKVGYQNRSNSIDSIIDVEIMGYATEVCRLKDILQDYKRNQENTHHSLPLPMPEFAEHFSKILSLVGLKNSAVKVNPTCVPSPCVHLTGPRCEVDGFKKDLESTLKKLVIKPYNMDGPGVQQYFQGDGGETIKLVKNSCKVEILLNDGTQKSGKEPKDTSFTSLPNKPFTAFTPQPMDSGYPDNDIHIKVVIGSLEEQQADVFVAPMINTNLTSTMIGTCLSRKAGQQFQSNFDNAKGQRTLKPGDVLEVDGTPTLGCSKVLFIECVPKRAIRDNSGKALHSGLGQALALCEQNSWGSIALPIIGPGLVLSISVKDAINILTHEITKFLSGSTSSLQTICITIVPDYPNSEEMFKTVCGDLSAKMVDNTGQACFHSLTTDLDEIITAVDGTQLHLVFGDITNETTDVIVNTTDFLDFQTGVCKDILTKAGSQIQFQLNGAQVQSGQIFKTQPGGFPCKQIMHVCGQRDLNVIKTLAKEIVVNCEHGHYQSVAIPAICTGKGGMEPKEVAKSILQGVKDSVQGANLQYLKRIRIILLKINIFLAFKAMAQHIFGSHTQLPVPAPLVLTRATTRGRNATTRASRSQSLSIRYDLNSLMSLPVAQNKAEFLVIGHRPDNVSEACSQLKRAYENHRSSHSFLTEDIQCLSEDEVDQLYSKIESLHLQIQQNNSDGFVIIGQKEGVNEVTEMVQGALRRQVKKRDQENLFAQVTWCILGPWGVWQKVTKEMNYKLEKRDVKDGIVDAQGVKWTVNLKEMTATARGKKQTNLKRLENLPDFSMPIYWDNMTPGERLKFINLEQSSAEYQSVKTDFKKTVKQTVLKIERIQNVNLRRLYEGRKIELENKNGSHGAGEKILYHGTTEAACSSIKDSNFNRRFAGQNATLYGMGTYFAVNASYSANPQYSVPASDGTQLMFVARVLTGQYTQGGGSMKTPPDTFDSVVDNMQNPNMFVVFHDCQAYPDYLITFK